MTKKMPSLFAKLPPLRPLISLEAVVDDWIMRFGAKGPERHRRDTVTEYCATANTLEQAITRACASRAANGKMHNHQSRVKEADRSEFAKQIILAFKKEPKEWDTRRKAFVPMQTFDALHDLCDLVKPPGIGPVTTYDVATRIGAYMKLEVQSLYLHAGVKEGWCLLYGVKKPTYELRIPRAELPKELRRIPTDEVEDMLCAYREILQPWMTMKSD